MTEFTAHDVLEYHAPLVLREVTDPVARDAVRRALESELSTGWNDVTVQFGAVWDRKGYPVTGSISSEVTSSSYRSKADRSDAMILVAVVIPEYLRTDETKEAITLVAAADERAKAEADDAARVAKLEKAAALRAEADKLESEAGA